MFLLNKDKFVTNFLPPILRRPKQTAWVKVLVFHVFDLWNELVLNYNIIVNDLNVTIETDVFQTYLRSLYPNVGSFKCFVKNQYDSIPTIYTQFQGEHHGTNYVFFDSEAQPSKYVNFLSEDVKEFDYFIVIPVAYSGSIQAITSLLNKYKPSGKRYQLIFNNITV